MSKRLEEQLRIKEELRAKREASASGGAHDSGPTVGAEKSKQSANHKILGDWQGGLREQLSQVTSELVLAKDTLASRERELEQLRVQVGRLDKAGVEWEIEWVKPELIDVPGFNRFQSAFDPEQDKAFAELVGNIEASKGNLQAGMVRPSRTKPGRFELIYGERRLRAVQRCDLDFFCVVAQLDDELVWEYRHNENEGRRDKGVVEHALSLEGLPVRFNQGERAEALKLMGISKSQLHRLRRIALVPRSVWEAVPSANTISAREALQVVSAYELDRTAVLAKAKQLTPQMSRRSAIAFLTGAAAKSDRGEVASVLRRGREVQVRIAGKDLEEAESLELELTAWLRQRGLIKHDDSTKPA